MSSLTNSPKTLSSPYESKLRSPRDGNGQDLWSWYFRLRIAAISLLPTHFKKNLGSAEAEVFSSFGVEHDLYIGVMMEHIVAYEGKVNASLGLLLEEYAPLFVPWANRRIDIEGTYMRSPYWPINFVEWVRELNKSKGKNEVFAVLLRTNTGREPSYQYVGHMGIHNIVWPHGCGTTGSIIGLRSAQGKGVGTEAKLLLLYHAFKVLSLRKIISNVKGWNAQSAGHLIKCGYKFVGRYRKHIPHDGRFVDDVLFEVFPEDWEPIWDAYQKTGTLPWLTSEQRELLQKEIITL